MAKRHESLIELSHDHHHGLALALRLKQGDSALLTDGWTHDRAEQAKRVQRFYREELRPHFAAEEQALFPRMKKEIPASVSLIDDLITQHRSMEQRVARLSSSISGTMEKELVALAEMLERHIRLEERELFPLFERTISPGRAAEIGEAITRVREEVAAELRSVVHVRGEFLSNARTENIYAVLDNAVNSPRWWKEVAGVHQPPEEEQMVLWLGGQRFACRGVDHQRPRLVRLQVSGDLYTGELVMSVEDAPGGRRVRIEVNLDPVLRSPDGRGNEQQLERRLSDSIRAALSGIEHVLAAS